MSAGVSGITESENMVKWDVSVLARNRTYLHNYLLHGADSFLKS
jgi:hypothetical protein